MTGQLLGFRWVSDYTTPEPIGWTDEDPKLFAVPNDVPEFTILEDAYAVDGQQVETLPGATVMAVRTGAEEAPDPAAIIVANNGRSLFRGFMDGANPNDLDGDGRLDRFELWRNVVLRMLGEDVPWLATASEITVPAGSQTALEVRLETGGMDLGTWASQLVLRSNEAVFSTYTVEVRMTVGSAIVFADGFESGDTSAWSR